MTILSVNTRFRAYQLKSAGSSFSYYSNDEFTLIEGRYCEDNEESIKNELTLCGLKNISNLHITSWDQDHCSPKQLERILTELKPKRIEYPGYKPHTDSGLESLAIIMKYEKNEAAKPIAISVTPEYIKTLPNASAYGYRNITYWPKEIDNEKPNDNSIVKQFRTGSFNVLSLGDVESTQISSYLRRTRSIYSEVDVMIMAHHGADNGFTTSTFLRNVKPSFAIATSNYGNQYNHPKQEIRDLLYKHKVDLFTTKTGDVIVKSINGHFGDYEVINLKSGSTEVSSRYIGYAKKSNFLKNNDDTLRDRKTSNRLKYKK
ncbi:ComEC/Rec2 family competence protein [Aeromonas hydrophila]|uniref:ComEC/Rec2 family competence protein n=1 Tax=Aeromonas hydrophila TaxID=644 RepID=UPI00188FF191|nr:hypothetical protein [Aeromonas hydrophila]MBF4801314.1 hypothetical protein [Aeromonas hydrophila]